MNAQWNSITSTFRSRCILLLCLLAISAPPLTAAIEFSHPGGIYANRVDVSLHSNSGTIRYTLDGTDPSTHSPVYSSRLQVTNSIAIKARCFKDGTPDGPVACSLYTILDEDTARFSSNLPLLVIDSFGHEAIYREKQTMALSVIEPASGGRATLRDTPAFHGWSGVAIRGSSSQHHPKKAYSLETRDDAGEDLKVPLLGMPKESDWVLYASYTDKTFIRDALTYELSNAMGRYAPRTRYVEVFINPTGNALALSNYAGLYVFMEKIKRDKHRVNIQKLKPSHNQEPEITGGYILKKDWRDPRKQYFHTDRQTRIEIEEPQPENITEQQRAWVIGYINDFEHALYGPGFRDPETGYRKYIDIDSFIDRHWIAEFSRNVDGYWSSMYLHKDRGGKLKMEPLWDWDLSYGNVFYRDTRAILGPVGEQPPRASYRVPPVGNRRDPHGRTLRRGDSLREKRQRGQQPDRRSDVLYFIRRQKRMHSFRRKNDLRPFSLLRQLLAFAGSGR